MLIPRQFHFVWLGHEPLPEDNIILMQSWKNHHREWTFNLWMEQPQPNAARGIATVHPLTANIDGRISNDSVAVGRSIVSERGGVFVRMGLQCFGSLEPTMVDATSFELQNLEGVFGSAPRELGLRGVETVRPHEHAVAAMPVSLRASSSEVTAVVISHNYGHYLRQCIESVLAQTIPFERILIYDDSSTDNTHAVATEFLDRGCEYHRVEHADVCLTRNTALSEVRTRWIVYVDADNYLDEAYLLNALASSNHHPKVAVVYPSIASEGRVSNFITAQPYSFDRLRREPYIEACALIKVAALRDVGGYGPARVPIYEDWALWIRLSDRGWDFIPNERMILHYRTHDANRCLDLDTKNADFHTLWESARVTLLTHHVGRIWHIDRYLDWLAALDCHPERVELYMVDNSHNPEFSSILKNWLTTQEKYPQWRYEIAPESINLQRHQHFARGGYIFNDSGQQEYTWSGEDTNFHCALMYGRSFSRCHSDFVFSVEDDVLPPPNALRKFLLGMAPRRNMAAIAAAVMNRVQNDLMAGYLTQNADQKFDLPLSCLAPLEPECTGIIDVDFTHAACTLYRTQALRMVQPRFEVRKSDGLWWYWDVALSADMRNAGWEIGLEQSVRPLHCFPDGSAV